MRMRIIFPILILAFAVSCITPSILVTQEQQAGDEANNAGQFQDAVAHYQKCLESSMKLGVYRNTEVEAQVCRKVSQAFQTLGKYKDASIYIGYAYSLDSLNRNHLGLLTDLREKGRIQLMQGDLRKGMTTFQESLKMAEGLDNSLKDANKNASGEVQLALANAHLVLGNADSARGFALAALDIFIQTNNFRGQAEANLLLGSIMSDKGAFERANSYFQKSISDATNAGLGTSRQYKAMAENMLLTGEYETALRYAIRAKNKADSSGVIPHRIWAEVGIGDVYRLMGDNEKAEEFYYHALELSENRMYESKSMTASVDWRLGNVLDAQAYFNSQNSKLASGLTFLRLGEIFLGQHQPDSALSQFRKASVSFESCSSREGITRATLFMTRAFLDMKKPQSAAETLDKANSSNKNPDLVWQIYFLQGMYQEATGDTNLAVAAYQKAIEEIESFRSRFSTDELKSSYMNNKMEVYDHLIRLLQEKGNISEAFSYAERGKARAFLDLLNNKKVGQKSESPSPLIEKEQALSTKMVLLKQQYNQSLLSDDSQETNRSSRQVISEELTRTQEQYAQLLLEIKLSNPAYQSLISVDPAEMQEIQDSMNPSEVLLEYWTGSANSIIWLIRSNTVEAITIPKSAADIDKFVDNFREAIQSQSAAVKSLAQKGYQWLLLPIASMIHDQDVIGIIPHGSLHLLPFQALMDSKGKYLVEKNNLFYTPSATIYLENKKKPAIQGDNLLAMALGTLNIGLFSPLPGTRQEVDDISRIWKDCKVTIAAQSTEALVKKTASQYQYLHLATHGYFNEAQPVFSFLLLAPSDQEDGQLTVNEVFGLNLNARIVVLSACQTGVGKINAGDEMVGLSRAFLYAGSRSVLASLWSVSDESTAALMAAFYSALKDHNQNEALSLAEKIIMKRWPDPYYWAPFQIIGNEKGSLGISSLN